MRLTEEQWLQIAEMRVKEKKSAGAIAKDLNISARTVWRCMRILRTMDMVDEEKGIVNIDFKTLSLNAPKLRSSLEPEKKEAPKDPNDHRLRVHYIPPLPPTRGPIKCDGSVSEKCVYGVSKESQINYNEQKCRYIECTGRCRPKREDGLCPCFVAITKNQPRVKSQGYFNTRIK